MNDDVDSVAVHGSRESALASTGEHAGWMRHLHTVLDERLSALFEEKIARARKMAPLADEIVEAIRELTFRGGKRVRPALLVGGYLAVAEAPDLNSVIEAAVATELMQSFLLIHDDWMDQDDYRRGGKTVHLLMRERFRDAHVGDSVAILCGNLASAYAWQALACSRFPGQRLRQAVQAFFEIQEQLVAGQLLDLVGEGSVDLMHRLKTGSYTVRGPLRIGAILGGGSAEQADALDRFAEPLGLAFQLRDDLLGTFGEREITGKPVGNDLRYGKRTALIAAAQERGSHAEIAAIERARMQTSANPEELAAALAALEACGARAAVEGRINGLVREALGVLDDADLRPRGSQLLRSIVSRVAWRDR